MQELPEEVRHHIVIAAVDAIQARMPKLARGMIGPLITAERLADKKLSVDELHSLLVEAKVLKPESCELDIARNKRHIKEYLPRVLEIIDEAREYV